MASRVRSSQGRRDSSILSCEHFCYVEEETYPSGARSSPQAGSTRHWAPRLSILRASILPAKQKRSYDESPRPYNE